MKEKLELMFERLKKQHPDKFFIRLVVCSDFSGEVVHGLDGEFDNQLIEFDDGEFFSWLDEFTDPNAEKRKRLHELRERIDDLRQEYSAVYDELSEQDALYADGDLPL